MKKLNLLKYYHHKKRIVYNNILTSKTLTKGKIYSISQEYNSASAGTKVGVPLNYISRD